MSKKLGRTIAGVALGMIAMHGRPADAAVLTYDFDLTVTSAQGADQPTIGQTFAGFFRYDDTTIQGPNTNFGPLFPSPNAIYTSYPTDFLLNFNGQAYTLADLTPYGRGIGGTLLQFKATGFTSVGPADPFNSNLAPTGFELVNAVLAVRTTGGAPYNLEIDYHPQSPTNGFQNFDPSTGDRSSGTATVALQTTAVPEPNGTLGLLVVVGLGLLVKLYRQ